MTGPHSPKEHIQKLYSNETIYFDTRNKQILIGYETGENGSGMTPIKSTLKSPKELEIVEEMESLGFYYIGRALESGEIPNHIEDIFNPDSEVLFKGEGNEKLIFTKVPQFSETNKLVNKLRKRICDILGKN